MSAQRTPGPLSRLQIVALEWFAAKADAQIERGHWRREFAAKTVNSLAARGLIDTKLVDRVIRGHVWPNGKTVWFLTDDGRAAIAKATGGAS